jgi:hypothetical protein
VATARAVRPADGSLTEDRDTVNVGAELDRNEAHEVIGVRDSDHPAGRGPVVDREHLRRPPDRGARLDPRPARPRLQNLAAWVVFVFVLVSNATN